MLIVGLTGGAGAGKDEVAKVFKKFDAKIIDADEVGHRLLKKNAPAHKKIIKFFGTTVLDNGGEINRKKLGDLVFSSQGKLRLLNKIIHPLMEEEFRKEIAKYRREGKELTVLNAAILLEAGWDKLIDKTILVTTRKELRIKRLESRGIDRERALAIFFSQWSDERKKKKADFIIENNGSLADLKKKIRDIIYEIRGK